MARHLEDAADALDEAPESLPEVVGTTGDAAEMLAALLHEIRRDPRVARVARPEVADVP
jgi:mitochondrial fission protein ELM1